MFENALIVLLYAASLSAIVFAGRNQEAGRKKTDQRLFDLLQQRGFEERAGSHHGQIAGLDATVRRQRSGLMLDVRFCPRLDLGLSLTASPESGSVTFASDPEFEKRYRASAEEPERAHKLLSTEVRYLLRTRPPSLPSVQMDDGGLRLGLLPALPQGRVSDDSLRASVDDAIALIERLWDARTRTGIAGALAACEAPVETLCEDRKWRLSRTPFEVSGPVSGAMLELSCRLEMSGTSCRRSFEATVRFNERLGTELLVQPMTMTQAGLTAIGGQDVLTGDEPFDERYRVKSDSPTKARELLGPNVRAALLELREYGTGPASVALTAEQLSIGFGLDWSDPSSRASVRPVSMSPETLTGLLHTLETLARVIDEGRPRGARETQGPYR